MSDCPPELSMFIARHGREATASEMQWMNNFPFKNSMRFEDWVMLWHEVGPIISRYHGKFFPVRGGEEE